MRTRIFSLVAAVLAMYAGSAHAGNIIMTGHDVLLHGGQRGFDAAALGYIRDGAAGTGGTYDIAVIGTTGSGFANFTGGPAITGSAHNAAIPLVGSGVAGVDSATFWDAESIAAGDFAGVDAIVILSHTSCGGCSITNAGSAALNSFAAEIATEFNAGLDIYANSGASLATYYDFLPPSVATSGPPISGSTGFTCTADGLALFGAAGCAASGSMINGFATHNRFTGFDASFTVFEERGTEAITIGLRGGTIGTDDITTDDTTVPEPGMLSLFGLGLLALGARRRRKA